MKKWVIFLILSIGFCITSVSCIKESSTFHWSVMVTNKTESAVYWAFAWPPNWDLEVPYYGYIEPDFKILPNETKKISILYGANSIEGSVGKGKMKVFFSMLICSINFRKVQFRQRSYWEVEFTLWKKYGQ